MSLCLRDLQLRQIIRTVAPSQSQLLSHVFLRQKPDGSSRLILNLKSLNSHMIVEKFKMETFSMASDILRDGDFMAKVDLKDAFYSVEVAKEHRKYLRFQVNKTLWEFQRMPNGLCSAPRLFTKLLKPVVAHLREMGIQLVIYLDDIWICSSSHASTVKQVTKVVELVTSLGFQLNAKKSILEPTQNIEFLGFVISSNPMSISLPPEKAEDIANLAAKLLNTTRVTLRQLAAWIGKLQATEMAIIEARLHIRQTQLFLIRSLAVKGCMSKKQTNRRFNKKLQLNQKVRQELLWWYKNIRTLPPVLIREVRDVITLHSDASLTGWGECAKERPSKGIGPHSKAHCQSTNWNCWQQQRP